MSAESFLAIVQGRHCKNKLLCASTDDGLKFRVLYDDEEDYNCLEGMLVAMIDVGGTLINFTNSPHAFAPMIVNYNCSVDRCNSRFGDQSSLLEHTVTAHTVAVLHTIGLRKQVVNNLSTYGVYVDANRHVREKSLRTIFEYLHEDTGALLKPQEYHALFTSLRQVVPVAADRRYYCYLLVDSCSLPKDRKPTFVEFLLATFYVGKGQGGRCFEHSRECYSLTDGTNLSLKQKQILGIFAADAPVIIVQFPLYTDLLHEAEALTMEAAIIELYGSCSLLSNAAPGEINTYDQLFPNTDRKHIGACGLHLAFTNYLQGCCYSFRREDCGTSTEYDKWGQRLQRH
uniref:C2H2-type domain-containing protein n=1 Tax=Steinernema glaseri TaxID=37863 RepID=A0A1I8AGJ4_9BILA